MKNCFVFLLVLGLSLTSAFAQSPQITISGSADVKVVPDEVNIRVGVETRNENLQQAKEQNDERVKSALAFLKTSRVPDKNVQTDYVSVTPEYNNDSWHTKAIIYIARKSIEINLTNMARLEAVLTGLLTNGVDHIYNVEFRTRELRKYRDQARALAVQAAKEKADALCGELGVKRGKPLTVNANEWGGRGYSYGNGSSQSYGGYASNAQVSVEQGGAPESAEDTLSLGQISVSATVTVSFAIE